MDLTVVRHRQQRAEAEQVVGAIARERVPRQRQRVEAGEEGADADDEEYVEDSGADDRTEADGRLHEEDADQR
eukprot:7373551-Prymnesium_polylepis.1